MVSHPKCSPSVSSILLGSEFGHPLECAQCRMSVEVLRLEIHRNATCHSGEKQSAEVSCGTNPMSLGLLRTEVTELDFPTRLQEGGLGSQGGSGHSCILSPSVSPSALYLAVAYFRLFSRALLKLKNALKLCQLGFSAKGARSCIPSGREGCVPRLTDVHFAASPLSSHSLHK